MKITFCITYHNQENFVKDSLESIFNIDFPIDFEILIYDDCSTDNTLVKVKEYQKKFPDKIKLFANINNNETDLIKRVSLNRLYMAEYASGDYIMFLDGDDFYCDKSFLKEAIEIFEKNQKIEAAAFNFEYIFDNKKKEIFEQKLKTGIISAKEYISKEYYTPAGAMVFKNTLTKDSIQKLKRIKNFDDNSITIFFLQAGNLYYTDKPIYTYRQNANSSWNSKNKTEQILLNALDYKLLSDISPMLKKEILKREFPALKYIYKHRKNLINELASNYNQYLQLSANDVFINRLLNWKNIKLKEKIKIFVQFQIYKFKAKYL